MNFLYTLEYDYDSYHCHGCGGCGDENSWDYCRGKVYEGLVVEDLNIKKVFDAVKGEFKVKSEMDLYCLDRLLRTHKAWDENLWNVEAEWGYYGEEVILVEFSNWTLFENDLKKVLELKTDIEKVKFVLGCEYKTSTEESKNFSSIEIKKISAKNVKVTENMKIDSDEYFWSDETLPIGLYKEVNGFYKLIDGRNRFTHNKNLVIKVIVLK